MTLKSVLKGNLRSQSVCWEKGYYFTQEDLRWAVAETREQLGMGCFRGQDVHGLAFEAACEVAGESSYISSLIETALVKVERPRLIR